MSENKLASAQDFQKQFRIGVVETLWRRFQDIENTYGESIPFEYVEQAIEDLHQHFFEPNASKKLFEWQDVSFSEGDFWLSYGLFSKLFIDFKVNDIVSRIHTGVEKKSFKVGNLLSELDNLAQPFQVRGVRGVNLYSVPTITKVLDVCSKYAQALDGVLTSPQAVRELSNEFAHNVLDEVLSVREFLQDRSHQFANGQVDVVKSLKKQSERLEFLQMAIAYGEYADNKKMTEKAHQARLDFVMQMQESASKLSMPYDDLFMAYTRQTKDQWELALDQTWVDRGDWDRAISSCKRGFSRAKARLLKPFRP